MPLAPQQGSEPAGKPPRRPGRPCQCTIFVLQMQFRMPPLPAILTLIICYMIRSRLYLDRTGRTGEEVFTYSVEDAEELGAGVNEPGLRVSFAEGGDDEELNDTEEALVRGDGEPGRVFLENRGLQDEPAGPRQAMADQEDTAQGPVLAAAASVVVSEPAVQHRRRGNYLQRRLGAVDGRALVECDN